jgi:hypothetical protein
LIRNDATQYRFTASMIRYRQAFEPGRPVVVEVASNGEVVIHGIARFVNMLSAGLSAAKHSIPSTSACGMYRKM